MGRKTPTWRKLWGRGHSAQQFKDKALGRDAETAEALKREFEHLRQLVEQSERAEKSKRRS